MNPPDILGDDIIVISGWATRSPRAAAPSSPALMRMMAFALADACTKVNRKRLNKLAARTGLYTSHVTPPEQETAWTNLVQEVRPGVPILLCTVKAQRQ